MLTADEKDAQRRAARQCAYLERRTAEQRDVDRQATAHHFAQLTHLHRPERRGRLGLRRPPDRVGLRLSPNGETQGCDDISPADTFGAAAGVAEELGTAYLELRQPGVDGTFGQTGVPKQGTMIRDIFTGPLIFNSDYAGEDATRDVRLGRCDAISFGRPYISNPDLDQRLAQQAPLAPNKDVPASWYLPGPAGYIDYPTMAEEAA